MVGGRFVLLSRRIVEWQWFKGFAAGLFCIAFVLLVSRARWETDRQHAELQVPWLHARIATWFEDRAAAISLTFDDDSWSAIVTAARMMDEKNVRATYFIITEHLKSRPPNFTAALRKLLKAGHELGSHTWRHKSLIDPKALKVRPELTDEIRTSVRQLRETFRKDGLPEGLTFSYPFGLGSERKDVHRELRKYFLSARTTVPGICSSHPKNMMRINAVPFDLYSDSTVKLAIQHGQLGRNSSWLVLFGHGVKSKDGLDPGFGPIEEADLKRFLNVLNKRRHAGDLWIETFGRVSRYILERENLVVSAKLDTSLSRIRDIYSGLSRYIHYQHGEMPIVTTVTMQQQQTPVFPEPVQVTVCLQLDLAKAPITILPTVHHTSDISTIACFVHKPNDEGPHISNCRCKQFVASTHNSLQQRPHLECCWNMLPQATQTLHVLLHIEYRKLG